MENKHTPGPWNIDPQFIFTVETRGNQIIAECCDPDGERSVEEDQANARLIAAAPDLLEALEEVLDLLKCSHHDRKAREAIKKARGEYLPILPPTFEPKHRTAQELRDAVESVSRG